MSLDMPKFSDLDALYSPDAKVATQMYEDPELFKLEMDKIFRKTWVWVAHDSEFPEKGSFKLSHVGLEPVIVVRDRKGVIHVMLNRCRHRAATVCEVKKGKTSSFQCPYHGWGYGLDGSLRALPYPEQYGDDFNKEQHGLQRLRTESYNGMVFATFNDDLESLVDFLGPEVCRYIDLFMKQGGGFPVKVLGEHQFSVPMNWKVQLENTTDAYHFPVVHKSFMQSLDGETEEIFRFLETGKGFVEGLSQKGFKLEGLTVLLCGAGGAARAIAFALAQAGIRKLSIHNRTQAAAQQILGGVKTLYPALQTELGSEDPSGFDLVVNATSLGMRAEDPLPLDASRLVPTQVVAEIIMTPKLTSLLERAQAKGCRIQYGLPMLECQIEMMADFMGVAK